MENKERQFYIQDARQIVGNSMLFWAKDCNGYTTDLNKAHVFSQSEIDVKTWRSTDHAWPKEYIDSKVIRMVDVQYVKQAFRSRTGTKTIDSTTSQTND